ncbi:hypothetical protein GCM10010232_67490 [Streptomyces amakusaensis]|uniref:DUF3592 domain-containing protein n=1 Tax=Streptomyces amakusaensis TaxID=67271 RepID=A0ABW0ARZ7_9ACTN
MSSNPIPELVIASGGTRARFDGLRLSVERDRTLWNIPVEAIRSAELGDGSTVRVELSGDASGARPGPGVPLSLPAANVIAAKRFRDRLLDVLATVEPAEDGHSLVVGESLPRFRHRFLTAEYRRKRIAAGVLLLWLVIIVSIAGPGALAFVSWLTPTGVFMTGVAVNLRIRPMLTLRRRGVTVTGRVVGSRSAGSKGSVQRYPLLTFTALDGTVHERVRSVVSVWATPSEEPMDVTYDPENPALATRPKTLSHSFNTVVMMTAGVLLTALGLFVLFLLATS